MTGLQTENTQQILTRFRSLQRHYHCRDVLLVDVNGRVHLSLSGRRGLACAEAAQALAAAFRGQGPVLTDLHFEDGDRTPHLGIVAPLIIRPGKPPRRVGAIILQADVRQFLYPLIQSWPTPSQSAETLLARRDGDAVLFLNDLRHQQDTALKLRIPLSRKDVPAVMAVLGKEGVFQGKDYRGVEVLAVLKAIPDSPWFMVAKVDAVEAFAAWRLHSILILSLIVGLLALAGAATAVIWQRNQKARYLTLYQAEAGRRQIEERHHITLMSIGDAVIVTDAEGRVELLNPVAEALTGWGGDEAHGRPLEEVFRIINEETRQTVESPVQRVLREGVVVGLANHSLLIARDGTERPIADAGALIRDDQGRTTGAVLIFRDQTQERAAQEAVRESEVRHRAMMEQSPDSIFLVDVDTKRVLEANSAFQQMLAYSAEEMNDLTLYDFVSAPKEDVDRRFQEVRSTTEPHSFEREYQRKDGSLIPVWIISTPISYGGRQVVCYTVRDLTEKKALDAQFLRAQRMESIGLLAGGIAHDLNNILAPILLNVELLQGKSSDPLSQKLLSSISTSAQRGADIVKQILTFSRGMEEEHLAISPKYLLKEMQRLAKETFPKSIAIEVEIPEDLWPLIGDTTKLHQALMNLCINARDAMEKGGTLLLSVRNFFSDDAYAKMHPEARVGPYLVFSVKDTGCGIPPSHLEKIFDPFFTTKESGMGTGLGLSTTQAIVKDHGGFIRIHSQVGKGTKFLVFLPASPTADMAKAEKERTPLPSGHGELILVVEDEASIREITQVTLETFGYRVVSAADGSEAVALYVQHKGEIQLLLTDMAMPVMDGLATMRALHRMNPHLKVIAVSGAEWEDKAAEATGLSVQAFLHKPYTAERLLRTVGEVMKRGGRGLGDSEAAAGGR
jgi:PAS domain S-box-containing protein